MTLLVEIGYCVFIWPKATRKLWVASVVGLHLGIAIFLGLGLFGSMMCVLTFAVFGISSEPKQLEADDRESATLGKLHQAFSTSHEHA